MGGETSTVEDRDPVQFWEKSSIDLKNGEKEVTKVRIHTYEKDGPQKKTIVFDYKGWKFEDEKPANSQVK